ncbi:unnamed protein product [Urochloa humidicola]
MTATPSRGPVEAKSGPPVAPRRGRVQLMGAAGGERIRAAACSRVAPLPRRSFLLAVSPPPPLNLVGRQISVDCLESTTMCGGRVRLWLSGGVRRGMARSRRREQQREDGRTGHSCA